MFNLEKLEHAALVEEAMLIVNPILKGYPGSYNVHTDFDGNVIFEVYVNGPLSKINELYELAKPYTAGDRCLIRIDFETGVIITFAHVLSKHKSIMIYMKKNGDLKLEFTL